MDKQQLLSELNQMVQAGQISQTEVLSAFQGLEGEERRHVNLSQVMYYIGATIVFLGICVLVFQNWENFNSATKIVVTLGSAIAAYLVGVVLLKYEEFKGSALGEGIDWINRNNCSVSATSVL